MRIGSIFGIQITINPSWVFIFALVAYSIAQPMGPLAPVPLSATSRVTLGIVASLLFFASVLFHELAHSLLARSRGVPVRGITLFIFGGVSSLDADPATPPSEAWISAVGPFASLLLGLVFYALANVTVTAPAIALMFAYLSFANVALALFNLLPAYPMDGGRVLHALVWRATGDRVRATRIAATIGGAIALILIVGGIVETLSTGSVGGLWMTFIGWFLLNAGTLELRQTTMQQSLARRTALDLIAPPNERVSADETADRVLLRMREEATGVFGVYVGDRYIGYVTAQDTAKVPAGELPRTYVTAVMTRDDDGERAAPADDALAVVRRMAGGRLAALAVAGKGGEVMGLITRDSIMHWLSAHAAQTGPTPAEAGAR